MGGTYSSVVIIEFILMTLVLAAVIADAIYWQKAKNDLAALGSTATYPNTMFGISVALAVVAGILWIILLIDMLFPRSAIVRRGVAGARNYIVSGVQGIGQRLTQYGTNIERRVTFVPLVGPDGRVQYVRREVDVETSTQPLPPPGTSGTYPTLPPSMPLPPPGTSGTYPTLPPSMPLPPPGTSGTYPGPGYPPMPLPPPVVTAGGYYPPMPLPPPVVTAGGYYPPGGTQYVTAPNATTYTTTTLAPTYPQVPQTGYMPPVSPYRGEGQQREGQREGQPAPVNVYVGGNGPEKSQFQQPQFYPSGVPLPPTLQRTPMPSNLPEGTTARYRDPGGDRIAEYRLQNGQWIQTAS